VTAVPAIRPAQPLDLAPGVPVLDVVIPVHNEEADLAPAVEHLHAHLASLPWTFRITVADNASTDDTVAVALRLCDEFADVRLVSMAEKGRGRALKRVWLESDSPVLVYMDVDLSTDLAALLPLVAPLLSGHSDVAVGTRLDRGSRILRGPKRELISRSYNLLLKGTLRAGFSDAQCGFKAVRRDVAQSLLPLVRDDAWFFDTELLVLAERAGLRIHEVPVDWADDPDSRVDIVRTAYDDLRGIARLGWSLLRGRVPLGEVSDRLGRTSLAGSHGRTSSQLVMFMLVGLASTVAYGVLYLLLRQVVSAAWANALALLATAVANTGANRRWTFGIRGPHHALRHQLKGLLVFAGGLAVTTGALWLLHTTAPGASHLTEVAVLTAANLLVTVMRFVLMRVWVFVRR
jgi:putative flippase GtrA